MNINNSVDIIEEWIQFRREKQEKKLFSQFDMHDQFHSIMMITEIDP